MFQRKFFSGLKKRPLVKPLFITSSNGRIIYVYGDNSATDIDALIIKKVLDSDKYLRNLLKNGYLALFDFGFKECIARLKADFQIIDSEEEDDDSTINTEATIKRSFSTASDIQNNPIRTKR
ncbi:unnamed protein product [Brachionus calyciflorus]|uniref:Uncharacterized protein n=1 Tax=Brachionus calyciflorus TaxID=104777 RepID=A0A813M318_9BILA|nr:unnamed protein product [Brachionus calyciflorus]